MGGILMGAKIINFPSYVVYDRSNPNTLSVYSSSGDSQNGASERATDKNLTTSVQITADTNAGASGNPVCYIDVDLGNIYWNTQIGYYVLFWNTSLINAGTYYIDTSTDAVNWTTQVTAAVGTDTFVAVEGTLNLYRVRAIRFKVRRLDLEDTQIRVELKEVSIMGSGS
jgi:hypothetical protein